MSRALRRAARLGPFFTILLPDDPWPADVDWHPFSDLTDAKSAEIFRRQVSATSATLHTDQERPIASLLHLGAASAICAPLLAVAACDSLMPDLDPAALQFGYPPSGRLHLAMTGLLTVQARVGLLPQLADHLIDVAIHRLLGRSPPR